MGFIAKTTRDGNLRTTLACDAPGCTEEISVACAGPTVIAVAPKDDVEQALLFACSEECADKLLAPYDDGQAGEIELEDWWKYAAEALGLADDRPTVPVDDVADAIVELEALVRRPGQPAGLSLGDGLRLGYVHPDQIAAVMGALA